MSKALRLSYYRIDMSRRLIVLAVLPFAIVASTLFGANAHAQQTWAIDNFHADITIQHDTSMLVSEAIDVDFGALQQHGIFRDIPVEYGYDSSRKRVYALTVTSVTNAAGIPVPHTESHNGPNIRIRIGDPGRTVSGKQAYRLTYRVRGALNPFADHDELYWNVNGALWPVPIRQESATVALAGGGLERAQCYEGPTGSRAACPAGIYDDGAHVLYGATRELAPGEQMTIVAAVRKGLLPEPQLRLEGVGPRPFGDYFAATPVTLGIVGAGVVASLLFVGVNWWRNGRDHIYTSMFYLSRNPEEETRPPFYRDQVVVEYTPPEDLRPAQMGLLLDERTDNKDVTATIVDLAVRGYVSITELAREGFLGRGDWEITRKKSNLDDLARYERTILKGLLGDRDAVKLSALHTDYTAALTDADDQLTDKALSSGWFTRDPAAVRSRWRWYGVAALLIAIPVTWVAAGLFDAGLVGVPVAFFGLLLIGTASWMPKRTAKGSELLRRVLGFRLYIDTSEKRRQEFAEKANIFSAYLPYAIVFGCVTKWAHVFKDIDTTKVTQSWYSGPSAFNAVYLSSGLQGLSHCVSSAGFNSLVNTPGGQGRSGFFGGGFGGGVGGGFGGGGFAGGGGGGGGGGAW